MKKTEKKKTGIRITDRKGKTYIAVKTTEGKTRYYKYNPNIPLDAYNEYAKNPIKKIKEYKREYKEKWAEKKLKNKKQKGSLAFKRRKPIRIDNTLKQGLTITTIKNVQAAGNAEFQKAYKELLKPLVLDKGLLKILANEETISKLRNRIEQKYTFNGQTEQERGNYGGIEEKLGTAILIGQKTPREGTQTIKNILANNELIYLHNGSGSTLISRLEQNGFNYKHNQNGQVGHTDLTLIFRKA